MELKIKRNKFNSWRSSKAGKNFIKLLYQIQNGRCNSCDKNLSKYHVDHVLSITNNGGNDLANYQLLCPKCNTSKGNRDDFNSVLYTDRIVEKKTVEYTESYYKEKFEDYLQKFKESENSDERTKLFRLYEEAYWEWSHRADERIDRMLRRVI